MRLGVTLLVVTLCLQWLVGPCTSLASVSVGRRDKATFIRRRKSGSRPKSTTKRTPRWEQEGDQLYQEILIDKKVRLSYEEASSILLELQQNNDVPKTRPSTSTQSSNDKKKDKASPSPPPHMAWGNLPVGPILKKQLDLAEVRAPTPIQEASFSVISKGRNAVIASPTGTGKTLAYLVPLLATKSRAVACQILIVTPTVELAYQIQGEVDRLWSPLVGKSGGSSVHVVGSGSTESSSTAPTEAHEQEQALIVREILDCPILCGTPRRIRDLLRQIKAGIDLSSPIARDIAKSWKANMKTIVLDEADRLLRTEGSARRKVEASTADGSNQQKRSGRSTAPAPTQTHVLLSGLIRGDSSRKKYQLICASATVGRTLRRQLMEIMGSPSIDKAAEVITADTRATGKDVNKRRSALLPDTISHSCVLLAEKDRGQETNDNTLESLSAAMERIKPSTTIVFPGRWGVKPVQAFLSDSMGLQNVLSIDDINNAEGLTTTSTCDASIEEHQQTWRTTPVYVIPDKFARGLDIGGRVQQVFLLAPPTSAAGYMHLAGRTGRNGQAGQAITLVRPNEVSRLATIAERVGVSFSQLATFDQLEKSSEEGEQTSSTDGGKNRSFQETTLPDDSRMDSWAHMSESQLLRKTVSELKQYMEENEIPMPIPDSGKKRILKADLIAAITG